MRWAPTLSDKTAGSAAPDLRCSRRSRRSLPRWGTWSSDARPGCSRRRWRPSSNRHLWPRTRDVSGCVKLGCSSSRGRWRSHNRRGRRVDAIDAGLFIVAASGVGLGAAAAAAAAVGEVVHGGAASPPAQPAGGGSTTSPPCPSPRPVGLRGPPQGHVEGAVAASGHARLLFDGTPCPGTPSSPATPARAGPPRASRSPSSGTRGGVRADRFTYAAVLAACGRAGDWRHGRAAHGLAVVSGLVHQDVFLTNSVITMYAKCGMIDEVRLVFDRAEERDEASWNLLLSAYMRTG